MTLTEPWKFYKILPLASQTLLQDVLYAHGLLFSECLLLVQEALQQNFQP